MIFSVVAAVLLLVFAVRLYREPRRLSNGVYLLLALLFLVMATLVHAHAAAVRLLLELVVLLFPLFAVVLGGFLIANGWIVLRREGRRPANALTLVAGVGIMLLLGGLVAALVVAERTGSRTVIVLAGTVILMAGYVGFVFTAFLLYSVLYGRLARRRGHVAIVVLGAGVQGGLVRPLLAARLDRAAALYRRQIAAGFRPVVVTSGGRGPDEPASEAQVMADYLREHGIPDAAILLEDRSTSTRENVRFSAELLAARNLTGPVLLVTSNYHVFRTAILSRRLGLRAEVRGARTAAYYLPNAFLREFIAILADYRVPNAAALLTCASVLPLLSLLHDVA
jgi:uncharacterized SAM-binding protein YcdF (DUF218 family)